jgi:hypothetical protein
MSEKLQRGDTMRKTLALSFVAAGLISSVHAAEDLASMFENGTAGGQIRLFYVDRDYAGIVETHRNATAVGGHLDYETDAWNGLSLGAAFYTTNRIFRGLEYGDASEGKVDPTLFGKDNASFSYLGESYVRYQRGNTTFKGGRQRLDTPLAGSDDARMLPNLFEAYMLSNTDLADTTLILAHVTQFAQGTFGRAYNAAADAPNAVLSVTSGYSLVDSRDNTGRFVNMGTYAIGERTAGVTVAAAIYEGIAGLKLQLWDYYAHDILNALYAEAAYGWSYGSAHPYVAAQWISERDVGSNSVIGKVESDFIGAKAGLKVANFDLYGAYSKNSTQSDAAINGGTLTPWGGMPAYTQGMVTRHQFMAGTEAWKVTGGYRWSDLGVNLNTSLYYTLFEMDPLNGYSDPEASDRASEAGFDVIYSPELVQNLQVRLRGNFPRNYRERTTGDLDWDEYRFIVNYNF